MVCLLAELAFEGLGGRKRRATFPETLERGCRVVPQGVCAGADQARNFGCRKNRKPTKANESEAHAMTDLGKAKEAEDVNRLMRMAYERGLEDAAKVADAEASIEGIAQRIAHTIRALKQKENNG
jgi:hypothetical protein